MGCRCPATSRTFPCLSELLFCSGVGNRSYRRQTPQPEFSGRSGDHPASIAGRARRKRRARQALASEARAWAYKARWKRRSHPSPARSRQGGAVQLATEIAFWNPWASAGWSQILAGSLLEADFGILAPFNRLVKLPSGSLWKRPLLGKSWLAPFWKQILTIWTCFGLFWACFWLFYSCFCCLEPFWAVLSLFKPVPAPGETPGDVPAKSLGLGFILC